MGVRSFIDIQIAPDLDPVETASLGSSRQIAGVISGKGAPREEPGVVEEPGRRCRIELGLNRRDVAAADRTGVSAAVTKIEAGVQRAA